MKKILSSVALILAAMCVFPILGSAIVSFDRDADALHDMGLFLGTNNGYELDARPTRAQAAVMLVRFLGKEEEAKTLRWTAPFKDVPDWAKPYVQYLYAEGLTAGYSESTYAPDDYCSAQMYATFLLRALGYKDVAEGGSDAPKDKTDNFDHIEYIGHTDWDSIYRIPLSMYDNIPKTGSTVDISKVVFTLTGDASYPVDHWVGFVESECSRHNIAGGAGWGISLFEDDKDRDGVKEHYMNVACSGLFGCPEHGGWTNETSRYLSFTGKDGKYHEYEFHMASEWPWNGNQEVEASVPVGAEKTFTYAGAISFAEEIGLITSDNCDTANFLRGHMASMAYKALSLPTADGEYKFLSAKLADEGVITSEQAKKARQSDYFSEPEAQARVLERPSWLGFDSRFEEFNTESLNYYKNDGLMTAVKNIKSHVTTGGGLTYISASSPYIELNGLKYDGASGKYSRTPYSALSSYSTQRGKQALFAAGSTVRFITDSRTVNIKVTTNNPSAHMNHTCSTAAFSTDIFTGSGTGYTIAATLKVEVEPTSVNTMETSLALSGKPTEVVVVLPLCTGIEDVQIGVKPDSSICAPNDRSASGPICFYGSDNVLGYGVVKPSENFVNLLSRTLNADVYNFGFPGTANGNKTDAEYISSLGLSALLLNYSSDLGLSEISSNYLDFYKTVRAKAPELPIIMMSDPIFDSYEENADEKAARDAVFKAFTSAGDDPNLYFIDGDWLIPTRFRELYTEDNHLLNGAGHYEAAKTLYSAFRYIFDGYNELSEAKDTVFADAVDKKTDVSKLSFSKVSSISGDALVRKEGDTVYLDGLSKYFEFTGALHPSENLGQLYRLNYSGYSGYSALNKEYSFYNAGERVRFVTDSKTLKLEFTYLTSPNIVFFHFPDTGSAGIDVYCGTGTNRKFLGNIAPAKRAVNGTVTKGSFTLPDGVNEIFIDLPIYAAVKEIRVGLDKNSKIALPGTYKYDAPICFYGSSITEGACATKPSSAYTNILARMLGVCSVNIGFSGGALGESYASDYIAKTDISAFVMDYDHNAPSAEHLKATHYDFYRAVRKAHPDIPIILMTMPYYGTASSYNNARKAVIKETYEKALKAGDKNIYYVDAESFFPKHNRDLYMVDFTHPNDLGFLKMAEAVYPVLKAALENTYGK